MAESPVGVLFLSGAGLPPWMWDDVRARITDRPTYVGPRPPGADASLGEHATAALDATGTDRFVIAAHSAGGTVAAKILELRPERVAGLLGVSCVIPAAGASFVGSMPFPNRVVLGLVMRVLGTRPPEKTLRARPPGFRSRSWRRWSRTSSRSRSATTATRRRRLSRRRTVDRLHHPRRRAARALQRSFARRLGVEAPEELATGHLPMLRTRTLWPGDRLLRGQRGRCQCRLNGLRRSSACGAVARSPG